MVGLLWLFFLFLHNDPNSQGTTVRFPQPTNVFTSIPQLTTLVYAGISALSALCVTIKRVAITIVISLCFSIFFALIGHYNRVWSIMQPSVDFLRSIPITFFLPVITVVTGDANPNVPYITASIPCTLIMLIQMKQGINQIDKERTHIIKLLMDKLTYRKRLCYLTIQEIMPNLITGLRLSTSYAIVLISVIEYLGVGTSEAGFGYLVSQLQNNNLPDEKAKQIAAIIVFGILGLMVNKILEVIEQRLTKWNIHQNVN